MTSRDEALKFLSEVYSSIRVIDKGETFETYPAFHIDPPSFESVQIETFHFPLASGKLGGMLRYGVELNKHRVENYSLPSRPEEEIMVELKEIFSREPHPTVQKAIKKLEGSTGKKAQIFTVHSWSYHGFYESSDKKNLLNCFQGTYSGHSKEEHSPQAFIDRL